MSADRLIVALAYTPVGAPGGTRRAVGGFLRYIHYRDQHRESAEVSGMLKYVAYRDRTVAQRGQLFGPAGPAGDEERRELLRFVLAGSRATRPQLSRDRQGDLVDRRRAVYRFVLSPEFAAGLDLKELTRAAMAQLQVDAGGTPLRWVAAEHRNTAHPHVHVVLAGYRETGPGDVRSLLVNRPRLARLKLAAVAELERQRSLGPRAELALVKPPRLEDAAMIPTRLALDPLPPKGRRRPRARTSSKAHARLSGQLSFLHALGRRYRHLAELAAEEERRRLERQGHPR